MASTSGGAEEHQRPPVVKRIVALLDLDGGEPATSVAARLGMTRQTLYNWVRRFGEEAHARSAIARGTDDHRSCPCSGSWCGS